MTAYSIVFSATVVQSEAVAVGDLVLPESGGSDFLKATSANRGSRRCHGIALTAWSDTSTRGGIQYQQSGTIEASLSGLASGSAAWVRCSSTGTIERFTPSAGGSSDVVGRAEADGRVHLCFGILTEDIILGGGSAPSGTGLRKVVSGTEDAAASLLVNADVDPAAALDNLKVVQGVGTQAMADANQTVAAGVYQYTTIKTTGALTASRDLTLPGQTDATARRWLIDNQCTGTGNSLVVKASSGAGGTVTVWPGHKAHVLVDSRGVTPAGLKFSSTESTGGVCAIGDNSYAEAGAVALGPSARATNYYAVAAGYQTTASGAGSVCLGEVAVASGANANCFGYSSTSSGTFANVLGSYCYASAQGATAIGLGANASRPGELHWRGSNTGGFEGKHWIDLHRDINATTAVLQTEDTSVAGGAFVLNLANLTTMRVILKAAQKTAPTKFAAEVRELLIYIDNGTATILNETVTNDFGGRTFVSKGWSCTISIVSSTQLNFSVNSGADNITASALCEWSEQTVTP